jgi:hypothetical protein
MIAARMNLERATSHLQESSRSFSMNLLEALKFMSSSSSAIVSLHYARDFFKHLGIANATGENMRNVGLVNAKNAGDFFLGQAEVNGLRF